MKALLRNYSCLQIMDSLNIIASNPGGVKEKAVSQSGKNGFICADAAQVVQSRRVRHARTQQTEEHRSRGARQFVRKTNWTCRRHARKARARRPESHTFSVCRSAYDEE